MLLDRPWTPEGPAVTHWGWSTSRGRLEHWPCWRTPHWLSYSQCLCMFLYRCRYPERCSGCHRYRRPLKGCSGPRTSLQSACSQPRIRRVSGNLKRFHHEAIPIAGIVCCVVESVITRRSNDRVLGDTKSARDGIAGGTLRCWWALDRLALALA